MPETLPLLLLWFLSASRHIGFLLHTKYRFAGLFCGCVAIFQYVDCENWVPGSSKSVQCAGNVY
jgi:hypothetical protein